MISSRKLLLISQVFYPDQVSTSNLLTNLCIYLVESGMNVEVWCAHPSYTESRKQKSYLEYKGINIYYLPSTNFHKTNLIGRMLNYITFMVSVIIKLFRMKQAYPVITHTTPPLLGFVVSWLCRRRHRQFLDLLLDIFPEGLIRLGRVSKRNPLIKLWERFHRHALERSHTIIVIGRDMEEWITRIYPEGRQKIKYIPLWHDDHLIYPMEFHMNKLINRYQLRNEFVIQYSGNMGLWNEMEIIAHAVNVLHKEVFFIFIGSGLREHELFQNLNNETRSSYIHLPYQPLSQFNEAVNACHVGLVSLRKNLQGIAVPSKLFGIMAAGKPVIAIVPPGSEIARVIGEESCGTVVDPENPDLLVDVILKLKNNALLRENMGKNGRRAFEQKYRTSIQSVKYQDLIGSLPVYD